MSGPTTDNAEARFDAPTLALLAQRREVRILTSRPDGTQRQTTIWVVVDGDEALVRSVRGDRGHWFQAALDRPDDVELEVDGQVIPVTPVLADDDDSIARCSAALEKKYGRSMSLQSMLQPHNFHTTIRLVPR